MTDTTPTDAPEQTDVSAADATLANTSNAAPPKPPEPSILEDLWSWISGQDTGTYLVLAVLAFYLLAFGRERWIKPRPIEMSKALRCAAIALVPIWGLIGYQILEHLWDLTTATPPTNGSDLRWHILAFLGLVTAFGATISAPLALVRVATTERQTRTAEQGHMTERITKAVEQLGTEKTIKENGDEKTVPNIEMRIGGLLSLERIAQDSTQYDQGRDHVRVMEIICAYIRENAPARGAKDFPLLDWEPLKDDATKEDREAHEIWRRTRFRNRWSTNAQQWALSLKPPREDIQTALNILKRRTADQRKIEASWPDVGQAPEGWVFDEATFKPLPVEPSETELTKEELDSFTAELGAWKSNIRTYKGYRLDLRHTNQQGADLSKAVFSGALLNGARMEGANLGAARLEGAYLSETRMVGANLNRARMEGAYLSEARMEGAYLNEARVEGANLSRARMEGAYLSEARMEGANLSLARLGEAYLSEARMEDANLIGARIDGADFCKVRMQGADLGGGTFYEYAVFQGAKLQAARWKNVTLLDVGLTQNQINASFGDCSVILPEGLEWPKGTWPEADLDSHDDNNAYQNWLKIRAP